MIDLYAIGSPNVLKVLLLLEELELAYRLHRIDIFGADQFTPEFRALNPNCKVPVIVDPDGPGGRSITVTESGAILFYLAEKFGRFLEKEGPGRTATMQWLMFQMGSVGPMFGQSNHFRLSAPPGHDYAVSRYVTEVRRLYDVLEVRLSNAEWLGGESYSIADMATWPWAAFYADQNGVDLDTLPGVKRWVAAVDARPATARARLDWPALQAFGLERRVQADPDNVDKLFGRGRHARP
ncbi:glutathione S-transferase N-terminal domain-containing protein [uncultured Novosphingobium sp.]|uniref:glutathione S-transferase N-terminal domain-containing protein n=1 Tax=uncultured Novosphingobium sp. TaxID=292277 RepID=UPI003747F2DD